jgi:hypothetical protein
MIIPILNDTHCGIRNSSELFIDNANKFYKEVFFPFCDEHKVKKVIHLGDYYDNRKNVNIKAIQSNRENFISEIEKRDITVDIILGNHDVYFKSTNKINSLESLIHSPNFNIITEPSVINYPDGLKLALIPWMNEENYEATMEFIKKCSAHWVGGHFGFEGFEMMKGMKSKEGLSPKSFSRFEKVLSGHFHTKSEKGNIHYLGSQLEFTWADAHDPKFFHYINTEEQTLEAVRNPHTVFQKIFYDDTKEDYGKFDFSSIKNKILQVIVIQKNDGFTFEAFIDKLEENEAYSVTIFENFTDFVGETLLDSDVSIDDTSSLLGHYIDAVDTDLDKHRLKDEMNKLYKEAETMEIV